MTIETPRLELVALTAHRLELWLRDMESLEQELDCTYRAEPIEGFFRDIVAGQLAKVLEDEENYQWHSFWLILRKSDRVVVGSADFKAPPDEKGEVEIGYGLGEEFEGQGYMSETVEAMCRWALGCPDVKRVIAETYLDGLKSQRVLKRCGFKEYSRGESVWWRLDAD